MTASRSSGWSVRSSRYQISAKMPIQLLVLDVLLFGLWALVLVVGGFYSWSVVVRLWPGLIAIPGLLPTMLMPAVVIAPMTVLAYFRPPQPLTIRIVGIATLVFFGLGLAIWPILAGARVAAKAKVPAAIVFLASGLAYALGVTLAFALLLNAEGIDLLILAGPLWAGGASVGGSLYLVGALVGREKPAIIGRPGGLILLLLAVLAAALSIAGISYQIVRTSPSSLSREAMPLLWEVILKERAYYREHQAFTLEKSSLGLDPEDHPFFTVEVIKTDKGSVTVSVSGRPDTAASGHTVSATLHSDGLITDVSYSGSTEFMNQIRVFAQRSGCGDSRDNRSWPCFELAPP